MKGRYKGRSMSYTYLFMHVIINHKIIKLKQPKSTEALFFMLTSTFWKCIAFIKMSDNVKYFFNKIHYFYNVSEIVPKDFTLSYKGSFYFGICSIHTTIFLKCAL